MDAFPLWLKTTCELYKFGQYAERDVLFIVPLGNLEFDQVVNIQRQVQKKLGAVVAIVVADDLPKSFRSIFVRMGIPYVVKGQSLFAPELNLKISDFEEKVSRPSEIDQEISPFELKLLSGFLTGRVYLLDWMNLTRLSSDLKTEFYCPSLSKMSEGVNRLVRRGFLETRGKGPSREFRFVDKVDVWSSLKKSRVSKFYKRWISEFGHQSAEQILAGETALSAYSSLAAPISWHIALTSEQLEGFSVSPKSTKTGLFEKPKFIVDVFKEPPSLFLEMRNGKKCLNSVELYFSLRNNSDERVQIALEVMLSLHGLVG